jgi:hypothetical protein
VIGGYGLLLLWPGFAQTGQAAPEASGAVAAGDATVLAESRPSADLVGSFPGSILIPGTELSIKLGGRIKVDAIHDFGAIGTTDEFKTSSIPVPGTHTAPFEVEMTPSFASLAAVSSDTPRKPSRWQMRWRIGAARSPMPPANTRVSMPPSTTASAPMALAIA